MLAKQQRNVPIVPFLGNNTEALLIIIFIPPFFGNKKRRARQSPFSFEIN
jgi:hypothetical protein